MFFKSLRNRWKSYYHQDLKPALIDIARQIMLAQFHDSYMDRSCVHYVRNGLENGYKECCIEFFTRTMLLHESPLKFGGIPDPDRPGYVRCPDCIVELEEAREAKFSQRANPDLCPECDTSVHFVREPTRATRIPTLPEDPTTDDWMKAIRFCVEHNISPGDFAVGLSTQVQVMLSRCTWPQLMNGLHAIDTDGWVTFDVQAWVKRLHAIACEKQATVRKEDSIVQFAKMLEWCVENKRESAFVAEFMHDDFRAHILESPTWLDFRAKISPYLEKFHVESQGEDEPDDPTSAYRFVKGVFDLVKQQETPKEEPAFREHRIPGLTPPLTVEGVLEAVNYCAMLDIHPRRFFECAPDELKENLRSVGWEELRAYLTEFLNDFAENHEQPTPLYRWIKKAYFFFQNSIKDQK